MDRSRRKGRRDRDRQRERERETKSEKESEKGTEQRVNRNEKSQTTRDTGTPDKKLLVRSKAAFLYPKTHT